jgi:superfamily II DNA or RNA helicase
LKLGLQLSEVQKDSIEFIASLNEDSVIILPTGSGKTRIVEFFGGWNGVAVVISPFQKLSDQLKHVLGESAFRWPLKDCSEEKCFAQARFIVVAIEHCEYNSHFMMFLKKLNECRGISRLFLDEVHHLLEADKSEFRACLGNFWTFRSKLFTNGIQTALVGLTATLRQNDINKLRKVITGIPNAMPVFRRSCYRSGIQIELVWAKNVSDAQNMCIQDSISLAQTGKTIVFGTSLHTVDMLATQTRCQAVTSGIMLDLERFEQTRLIIASSCAGHGLDLRDIRTVCILGVPFDAETLIQWGGRIRETGLVKLFLDVQHVIALSKWTDRRGELAKLLLKCKYDDQDPQEACCRLLDYDESTDVHRFRQQVHDLKSAVMTQNVYNTQLTQAQQQQMQLPRTNGHHVCSLGHQSSQASLTQSLPPSAALKLEAIFNLKVRIRAFFSSFPIHTCKVCYILGDTTERTCGIVCRKFSGICVRCFQRHASRDCSSQRFVISGKTLCYKCFLPFSKGVGPDLHPGPIGAQCTSQVCEALPQAAVILFFSRSVHIPARMHGDFGKFTFWLQSVDDDTGMHGILTLLSKLIP